MHALLSFAGHKLQFTLMVYPNILLKFSYMCTCQPYKDEAVIWINLDKVLLAY